MQIPDPKRHLVRYYGAYSYASRGKRKKAAAPAELSSPHEASEDAAIPDGPYRVIGFITQPALIDRILDLLRGRDKISRPLPLSAQPLATPA